MDDFITYQLHIHVEKSIRVRIGKLGIFDFPKGTYIYTGSAKRNIEARIRRHLSKTKKLRWHIDYLLNSPHVMIDHIKRFREPECKINQITQGLIIVSRFGASDCQSQCASHLKYQ
jgi:Uri superfamily endonuclease